MINGRNNNCFGTLGIEGERGLGLKDLVSPHCGRVHVNENKKCTKDDDDDSCRKFTALLQRMLMDAVLLAWLATCLERGERGVGDMQSVLRNKEDRWKEGSL